QQSRPGEPVDHVADRLLVAGSTGRALAVTASCDARKLDEMAVRRLRPYRCRQVPGQRLPGHLDTFTDRHVTSLAGCPAAYPAQSTGMRTVSGPPRWWPGPPARSSPRAYTPPDVPRSAQPRTAATPAAAMRRQAGHSPGNAVRLR